MEEERLNYWINVGLLIFFIVAAVTGLVLQFAFVSNEPGVGRNIDFLGTNKADWLPWHSFFGIAMIVFAAVHIVLHFGWISRMTKRIFKRKNEATIDTGVVPRAVRKR